MFVDVAWLPVRTAGTGYLEGEQIPARPLKYKHDGERQSGALARRGLCSWGHGLLLVR